MAKHKLFYGLTEDEAITITEWLVNKNEKDTIGGFMLDFFKDSVINARINKDALIRQGNLTEEKCDAELIEYDEEYVWKGQKKVLVFQSHIIIDGLQDLAILQNALNRKDIERLSKQPETEDEKPPIFSCVDEYLEDSITEKVKAMDRDNYKHDVEAEVKKIKKMAEKQEKEKTSPKEVEPEPEEPEERPRKKVKK